MASYLVIGAARGLGFEWLKQLSADPKNIVVGLVRNKASTLEKVASEINRPNVHLVQADLVDYDSLKEAITEASGIFNGALDYLIANAGMMSEWSAFNNLEELGAKDPKRLAEDMHASFDVNVVGQMHVTNLCLPLIRKGTAKKVIYISTGHADSNLAIGYDVWEAGPYCVSKAGLNNLVAKYAAQSQGEGILFMAVSPGMVATSDGSHLTAEQMGAMQAMVGKFSKYAPHWKGPITPTQSVEEMRALIDVATIEGGYSGAFISHRGKGMPWL